MTQSTQASRPGAGIVSRAIDPMLTAAAIVVARLTVGLFLAIAVVVFMVMIALLSLALVIIASVLYFGIPEAAYHFLGMRPW